MKQRIRNRAAWVVYRFACWLDDHDVPTFLVSKLHDLSFWLQDYQQGGPWSNDHTERN